MVADSSTQRRAGLWGELALALLPTATILVVLAVVESLSNQRLLFASLAASAFLIYMDPGHATNSVRTLVLSQLLAAGIGFGAYQLFGPGYASAASAMVLTIVLTVLLRAVHPPAVATTLAFAFKSGPESNLALFGLSVLLVALLVVLQRSMVWILGLQRARPQLSEEAPVGRN